MEPQSSGILHTNLRTSQLGRPRISGAHLASRDAPRTSGLRPSVLGASLDARCAPSMLCRLPHGASPLGAPSLLGSFGLYVKSLTFRLHSCIVTLPPSSPSPPSLCNRFYASSSLAPHSLSFIRRSSSHFRHGRRSLAPAPYLFGR